MPIKIIASDNVTQNDKILFLGYDMTETKIIKTLISDGYEVWHCDDYISRADDFDLIICFGYRHILKGEILNNTACPIINLHISYLPYNRGSHPNFWAFFDGTPSGVTIHMIDKDIDTGDIICQKQVQFDLDEKTFTQTHHRLMKEAELLFMENRKMILSKSYTTTPQRGMSSYHKKVDLPKEFSGWDSIIIDEITRLDALLEETASEKNDIINEIENVRSGNNVNWMDLLRLAFSENPSKAKEIVRRINNDDNKISDLFKRLGE